MDKLIEFSLVTWPTVFSVVILFFLILMLIAAPIVVLLALGKFLAKDRFILKENGNHLYRLDTISGRVHVMRGIGWVQEMYVEDLKKEKKEKK